MGETLHKNRIFEWAVTFRLDAWGMNLTSPQPMSISTFLQQAQRELLKQINGQFEEKILLLLLVLVLIGTNELR